MGSMGVSAERKYGLPRFVRLQAPSSVTFSYILARVNCALSGQGYAFGAIAIIVAIRMFAVEKGNLEYDRESLDPLFWYAIALWLTGFCLRIWKPHLAILYMLEGTALMLLAGGQTTIATSAVASMGAHYADTWLVTMDSMIAPWFDWPAMVRTVAANSELYAILNFAYISAGWQPLLLMFIVLMCGRTAQMLTFVTAGALSLAVCLAVFAWMPAQGAFAQYGITFSDVSEIQVSLGFDFLPILEGLRNGEINRITKDNLSGLVSFPSMHASVAATLALAWARLGRWSAPMVALNALMAFSAMPVGNHYLVDIIAGVVLGAASFWMAGRLVEHSRDDRLGYTDSAIGPQSRADAGAIREQNPTSETAAFSGRSRRLVYEAGERPAARNQSSLANR